MVALTEANSPPLFGMLHSPHSPGAIFEGRFRIEAEAGRGGMGVVYRARDEANGQRVALKLLLEGTAERFLREASVLAGLAHDHVVRYVGHGVSSDGTPWLAMEWLEGEELATRIGRGPLSFDEALHVLRAIASGLGYAHTRGIVHRDVKPSNVFLLGGELGRAKILDFGIARDAAQHTRFTQTGAALGTPAYMAPEQARGDSTLDARADVFSLGCVFYEALVGEPPFTGPHPIAVLAKILFEDPARPSAIRPELPPGLDDLVLAMLAKAREERPSDAGEVLARLAALDASAATRSKPKPRLAREERVVFVLVTSSAGANDATLDAVTGNESISSVEAAARSCGGTAVRLANGAALALFAAGGSPHDLAARAATAALKWRDALPETSVALATGRAIVDGVLPVGDAIDRAVRMVLAHAPGVRVCEKSADLLEARFRVEVEPGSGARLLIAPRPHETLARTVLGRESPLVGRERELAMLDATIAAAFDEHETTVALLIAPAGTGKSRLLGAALDRAAAARQDLLLLRAAGDAMRAGTPYDIARQILANTPRHAWPSDPEVAALLREVTDTPVPNEDASEALRAARADPGLLRQRLTHALGAWLDEASRRSPVVIAIEDLHWGDDPSVALLDAAFGALTEAPIMILATARPEIDETFDDLFAKRSRYDVRLTRLTARASERYVRELLPSADDETISFIVDRSGGHPFYLEELVRLVARGGEKRDIPDSILGMVQSRFDRLGADAKVALRAASVFGEVFPPRGVSVLAGAEVDVGRALRELEDEEIVHRVADAAPSETRSFLHALLRDAAYESIPAADRPLAHAHAADYFEEHGPSDPLVLAEHRMLGGQPELSARWLARAAEDALEAHEAETAVTLASRALEHATFDRLRGDLERIVCEGRYWLGDLVGAAEAGRAAAARLAHGSLGWLRAVHVLVNALGQLGQNADVAEWAEAVAEIDVPEELRQQQMVLLARCVSQLVYAYEEDTTARLIDRLEALEAEAPALDARTAAHLARTRSDRSYLLGEFEEGLRTAKIAQEKFDSVGMLRERLFVQMLSTSFHGFIGRPEQPLAVLGAIAAEADAMGLTYIRGFARYQIAFIEALHGLPGAIEDLERALVDVKGSVRLEFGAASGRALFGLHEGRPLDTLAALDAVRDLPVAVPLKGLALGLEALALVRLGRSAQALEVVGRMTGSRVPMFDPPWGVEVLAEVEAHEACGDRARAVEVLTRGIASLEARLARTGIPGVDLHTLPFVGARLAELARAWNVAR